MKVVVQYFESCPGWRVVARGIEDLIERHGLEVDLRYQRVETLEEARAHGFHGSPTILVDGRDPFAGEDAEVCFACRIYRTETGPAPSPSIEQLAHALGI